MLCIQILANYLYPTKGNNNEEINLFAGEQGYAVSQFTLGGVYEKGDGVAQNYAEAVKWFKFAGEQGYAEAQYKLGCITINRCFIFFTKHIRNSIVLLTEVLFISS